MARTPEKWEGDRKTLLAARRVLVGYLADTTTTRFPDIAKLLSETIIHLDHWIEMTRKGKERI